MAKVYTPAKAHKLKEVSRLIEDKPQHEKALYKAHALANAKVPLMFERRGYTIQLYGKPRVNDRGFLEVSVRAWKGDKEVFVDNPLFYVNPPIMVPDGTFYKDKNINGEDTDYDNMEENVEEALMEIITQTVEVTGK